MKPAKPLQLSAGLNRQVIKKISQHKNEPDWMLAYRLKSFQIFQSLPLPKWGPDLSKINFNNFSYYQELMAKKARTWDEIPDQIKIIYDKLGLPEAEQKYLAGVSSQYQSQVLFDSIKKDLTKKGVIFTDIDSGLRKYPKLFKKYFASVISAADHKFSALNGAVWSGGSFVYVPAGVKVTQPLQAYFLINIPLTGQFERTLIILEKGSQLNYIEGCSAPLYKKASFHAGVVEIILKAGARMRYTTVQNWSRNVYNLTTQRAKVYRQAKMEWVDGNIGSRVTIKYPCCLLMEEGASGQVLSLALAGQGQTQDTGAKMYHLAPRTFSQVVSKSISKSGGRASYRGLIYLSPKAVNSKSSVSCDALILDSDSRSDTYPVMEIKNRTSQVVHETVVSRLDEEKIIYLMSRGLDRSQAEGLMVSGFASDITREIPLEYAGELNKLIKLEMEGSVG